MKKPVDRCAQNRRKMVSWSGRIQATGRNKRHSIEVILYYRGINKNLDLTSHVIITGVDVLVDMGSPHSRFSYISSDAVSAFSSFDQLAEGLKLHGKTRSRAKRAIWRTVTSIARRIEEKYPDSTAGLAGFIGGKAYRTPLYDGFYDFSMEIAVDNCFVEYLDKNSCLDLDYHLDNKLGQTWPLSIGVRKRSRDAEKKCTFMCDPYAIIKLICAMAGAGVMTLHMKPIRGKTDRIRFRSFPKHNRIVVDDPIGEIHLNQEMFIQHLLQLLLDILQAISTPLVSSIQYDTRCFLLSALCVARKSSDCCNSVFESSGFDEKNILSFFDDEWVQCVFMDTLLGAGDFIYDNPRLDILSLPSIIQEYVYIAFRFKPHMSLTEFLEAVREDPFQMWPEQ